MFGVQWNKSKQERKDPVVQTQPPEHDPPVAVGRSPPSWRGGAETEGHKLDCPD